MKSSKKIKSYLVYILRCADDTLYIGTTNDISRRLKEHSESKKGARYTRIRRPVALIYKEVGHTRGSALKREYELKQLSRGAKLELIENSKFSRQV
ncbi:MAG: GIY-YIG nuclease family protein [Patescibacteria group bacterium]